jgi:S1-C subfamily serine protease
MKGELVGVNAQIQTRFGLRQNTGIGYAVSSNQVRRFLPALKAAEGKLVPSGRLPGISVKARQDAPPVIEEVDDGSAAAEAGLKAGDVICGLDRAPIEESRDLGRALGRYPIGATVTLHVRRKGDDGKTSEHKCKLDIARHGKPYIGFKFKLRSARSMEVEVVEPGSPAAKAGVKKGDHLVGFVAGNRARPLRSRRLYYRLFRRLHPGVRIRLIFRRGKKNRIVTILVSERE